MKDNKTLKIIILITGILTVLLGIYTLVRPMRTFLSIGWILGILLFVNGIELVALSLSKEKKEIGACILGVLFCFDAGYQYDRTWNQFRKDRKLTKRL